MTDTDIDKLEKVAQKAEDVFWEEVAKNYPHIETGDFPPDAHIKLIAIMRESIAQWIEWNDTSMHL